MCTHVEYMAGQVLCLDQLGGCRRRFQRTLRGLAGGQHFGKPITPAGIIAGHALIDFQHLSCSQQAAVAKACDSSRLDVLTALSKLAAANVYF